MNPTDEFRASALGAIGGVAVTLLLVVLFSFGPNSCMERSHRFLGSKGGPCFANNTCRENLVCLHGEGAEPGICAGKAAAR